MNFVCLFVNQYMKPRSQSGSFFPMGYYISSEFTNLREFSENHKNLLNAISIFKEICLMQ